MYSYITCPFMSLFLQQVNTTLTYAVVTSNLTITDPVPGDSSLIQCVGFANNGFETMFLVNQASLTIIG